MSWPRADAGAVVAGAVAGVLLVVAVAWWAVERVRTRRAVARGLCSADPAVRAGVVAAVAGQGIRSHARRLLVLAERDDDPIVRRALVDAVVRSQWEPATDRRLLALRVWAAREAAADGVRAPAVAVVVPITSPAPDPLRSWPDAVAPVG